MKTALSAVLMLTVALGVAAQAQQPGAVEQEPGAPDRQAAAQAERIAVSGCVQMAPPAAPTPGAAPATAGAPKFELTDAMPASGTPIGTTGAEPDAKRYLLEGDEKTIAPHLNHQVEVTGIVTPATPTAGTAAPVLEVDSLTMLATKCQ
jgi:hypothetical protein